MLLALVIWLCSLPLVVLIVAPLFGLSAAGIVGLVLFFVVLVICWGVCSWKISQDRAR
jgi:hypothetical protein